MHMQWSNFSISSSTLNSLALACLLCIIQVKCIHSHREIDVTLYRFFTVDTRSANFGGSALPLEQL